MDVLVKVCCGAEAADKTCKLLVKLCSYTHLRAQLNNWAFWFLAWVSLKAFSPKSPSSDWTQSSCLSSLRKGKGCCLEIWRECHQIAVLSLSHMHLYRGWCLRVLQVFGLSWEVKNHREDGLHLLENAGVSCTCSLGGYAIPLRDVMKMDCAIVMHVVSASWSIPMANTSSMHLWLILLYGALIHHTELLGLPR